MECSFFLEADRQEIALRRGPHNRLGFAYQVAFVRVLGRFPQQAPLEIDGEILRFAALQLGADGETIHAYAGRQQTVSEHQQRIGEYLRLRAFDAAAGERLARFLEDEALRLERTASLLARARAWLRDEHVLAPADSVLRRAIGAARHKARTLLTQRMAERLSAPMRERLDALIAVDDDQPHSPLNRIKASSSNPSVGGMKRLLARLELIEATGVLGVDVGWVNGNYQRILPDDEEDDSEKIEQRWWRGVDVRAWRVILRTVIDIDLPTSRRRSLSFAAWHAWDAARLFPSVSLAYNGETMAKRRPMTRKLIWKRRGQQRAATQRDRDDGTTNEDRPTRGRGCQPRKPPSVL